MAVTYGFFNSVNGDRKYNADQMSDYFRGIVNEGVFQHLNGGLAVVAGTGMEVTVATGRAIVQNKWIQNDVALPLTIEAASDTYGRKDAVVIRLSYTNRNISIVVKTGTPAASPVAPSMTRNATTYEMALAYVNVAANATSVTVTDKRSDSSVCGWISVAQEASGEVDAMLEAMKTGFDGVEYSSPAAMVQGEDQKLQAQIDAITTHTDNRYNPADNTADVYVDPNTGSEVASSSFFGTGYIPVTPGETLYFWGKDTNNTYSNFYKRMIAAFDASKEIVASAGTGSEYPSDTWTVPAGVYYVRFTIAYAKVTGWTNLFCGLHPIGVDYVDYGVIPLEKPQVDANTAILEEITKDTNNVLNFDELISKYIATDGSSAASIDLVATSQYIPVKPGDRVYGWGYDSASGLYKVLTFRFVCAYNSSKNAVSASGTTFLTPPFVVPDGISYVRITLYRNQVYGYDHCYIGLNQMGDGYAPYGKEVKIQKADTFTIHTGESLLEGVMYCYENAIQNLIVESGTYDLIAEYKAKYGNDYFENYVDYSNNLFDAGIWLQNINVKFNIGAKVVCKYTGSNQNVIDNFSAFATGNNVLIDGLVLDSENLRYGIHADYNSGDEETFFIMRNCDLKNVRTDGNKNIGAGLGKHVFWLFENCIFRSTGEYYVLRIHNSVNADAESKIIVKDCYIDGNGFFVFNSYSTSTKQTIVQVCGNSYKTVPVVGRETSGSTDNITMIAWNNEVRTS